MLYEASRRRVRRSIVETAQRRCPYRVAVTRIRSDEMYDQAVACLARRVYIAQAVHSEC